MARAGIENALWDVEAQQKNLSLAHLLGGTQSGHPMWWVSLGLQVTPEVLLEKVAVEASRRLSSRQRLRSNRAKIWKLVRAVRNVHVPASYCP